jgi:hypothetical protein
MNELVERLKVEGGYVDVKILPDGSIAALGDLLYTRAIHLGCHEYGWQRRFCFSDRSLADRCYAELQSEDDEPSGYIARRGK